MSEPNGHATRAVLWDLDGTLVDSAEFHWLSWRDAMRLEGVELSREAFLASFGQRNDRILTAWFGPDADPARLVRIGEGKETEYRRLAETHGLAPLPGAVDWLAALRRAGWRQAIASSAPRENAETMLRVLGLTAYFDAIVAAEDVTIGKPDPLVFLVAASRLAVNPARCVVVEDAPAGVEGARRAGMRSIGVNGTSRLEADVYVTSLTDLDPDAFDRLIAL